jgi:DNA integrity scanning protein DisA with diadenylate cyclase activity
MSRLPPQPDFAAIDAAAAQSAEKRAAVLALVGNLVFSWSNNESMFIYVLMLLMDTDEVAAAIVFATLNTTRARLELIQRLAKARLGDRSTAQELEGLIRRFNACTRVRNEFNHSMFTVNERGEITHTQAMRIQESRGRMRFGVRKDVDENRLRELNDTIAELARLNRDIWEFLPRLEARTASSPARRRSFEAPTA